MWQYGGDSDHYGNSNDGEERSDSGTILTAETVRFPDKQDERRQDQKWPENLELPCTETVQIITCLKIYLLICEKFHR